jgi:hypothetical protein
LSTIDFFRIGDSAVGLTHSHEIEDKNRSASVRRLQEAVRGPAPGGGKKANGIMVSLRDPADPLDQDFERY